MSFMYNKKIDKPTDKQIIGQIGEDFACKFIKDKGFNVVERNYYRKWGEIDIIVKKGNVLHFIEVKTVSCEKGSFVKNDSYRPEDNIHHWKLQRLSRVIQSYLLDKDVSDETDWKFDVITVYLDKDKNLVDINLLEDIVL